jgi:hypothetical protein
MFKKSVDIYVTSNAIFEGILIADLMLGQHVFTLDTFLELLPALIL